jgi:hypothetical protein
VAGRTTRIEIDFASASAWQMPDRVLDQHERVDLLAGERQLSLADAGDVEQIVDQPGLELDVAADERGVGARFVTQRRVFFEDRRQPEDRRQRRAQLVAEYGQELVFGLVGRVGFFLGTPQVVHRAIARGVEPAQQDGDPDERARLHGPAEAGEHREERRHEQVIDREKRQGRCQQPRADAAAPGAEHDGGVKQRERVAAEDRLPEHQRDAHGHADRRDRQRIVKQHTRRARCRRGARQAVGGGRRVTRRVRCI